MRLKSLLLAAGITLAAQSGAQAADFIPDGPVAMFNTAESAPPRPDPSVQRAEPADMRIMERYIGTFRSTDKVFDDGETGYHFTISYEWFDMQKTIVKYRVSMVIPSQDRTLVNSEGFYGYDPFSKTIYIFGAFRRGMSGWGSIGAFDHESGSREVWATSMRPDGVVMHVRDRFEVLDANSWKNSTRVREGDTGEWQQVYEDTYTRVPDTAGELEKSNTGRN